MRSGRASGVLGHADVTPTPAFERRPQAMQSHAHTHSRAARHLDVCSNLRQHLGELRVEVLYLVRHGLPEQQATRQPGRADSQLARAEAAAVSALHCEVSPCTKEGKVYRSPTRTNSREGAGKDKDAQARVAAWEAEGKGRGWWVAEQGILMPPSSPHGVCVYRVSP